MMKQFKITLIPIGDLKPFDKNARVHSQKQIEKIAASIKEFGFVNPILIGKHRDVIAGHGRLEAAKLLGLVEVPAIELDHLTEKQKRALVLADNRIAEDARWDFALLKSELSALDQLDFDLELIGFTTTELDNLLPDLEAETNKLLSAAAPKPAPENDDDYDEQAADEEADEEETVELKKEVIGAKELSSDDFQNFAHQCPRCGFEFNK